MHKPAICSCRALWKENSLYNSPKQPPMKNIMDSYKPTLPIRLFYSYCHKDAQYRESMETSLALLERNGLLKSWDDRSILPGQRIPEEITTKMDEADIIVHLLSQNFIKSTECMKEWDYTKQLATNGKPIFRIPVILTACAWKDLLEGDDQIKVLPDDGKEVAIFEDHSVAWQQVYEGIKVVVDRLRNTFTPKREFLEKMEETEFLSQQHIKLQDIFIFLPLSCNTLHKEDNENLEDEITTQKELLKKKRVLIYGEETSGKTALARHLFLSLTEMSNPILYIDANELPKNPKEKILHDIYSHQFNGDYSLWAQKNSKTLILDNLSSSSNLIDFIVCAKDIFERIIVISSTDIFYSYFRDEQRLADFCEMEIKPLTHRQQEKLIRKRLELSDRSEPVTDGLVDQVESRVNSVIIANKIVPRYPFYVLSILQTYEGYMPSNFSITSYGHCYYVLILASLIKAGISRSDKDINTCFNFSEHLAFRIYKEGDPYNMGESKFNKFISEYREKFIIPESTLNRLKRSHSNDYGIINRDGSFRTKYMYYFFLGSFLSKKRKEYHDVINTLCERSYSSSSYLVLFFIIHHTEDDQIINNILNRTTRTLDAVNPAILDHDETKRFGDIFKDFSKNILSNTSVDEERGKERDRRDISERQIENDNETEQIKEEDPSNDLYRILKNNEIMGHVLMNKSGSLEKEKIMEIVENIADSGLRLVNLILKDEREITAFARYIQAVHPGIKDHKIENIVRRFSFLWTMVNVEKIVSAINHSEIREIVNEVVCRKSTPAYDLIGYFSQLDSAPQITNTTKRALQNLLKKHNETFLNKVLSIRTQYYMNTHRSEVKIEQSVCSLLGIKYLPKYRR